MRAWKLGMLVMFAIGCTNGKDGNDTDVDIDDTDAIVDTDIADTDVADTDTAVLDTDVTDTDPADTDPPATNCKDANGICTASNACGRGQALPTFAADCVFSDGPGVCCKAPPEQPTGDTCRQLGGVCAPIGGCYMVDGYITSATPCYQNFGASYACCVPESQCGPSLYECCDTSTVFVSSCIHGVETCDGLPGTTKVPVGTCIVP